MPGKLVSVILPCYNQGKYIEEAIQSVLSSTYANIEIIIVNDGSTDAFTNEILKQISWNKTIVYTIPNNGVAYVRNFGIGKSHGDYILPLDADDRISQDYIEKSINILDARPEVKIVYCEVEMFGAKKGKYPLPEYSIEMMLAQNTMVVSSMFRRTDFDKTPGYNRNMTFGFEDWDFWLTLLEDGGEVHKLEHVGLFYRINRRSRNSSIKLDQYAKLRRQIYENHKKLFSTHFLDPSKSFEYDLIRNSKEYKLGKAILKSIRFFLNY